MTRLLDSVLFLFGAVAVAGALFALGNFLGGKRAPWLGIVFVAAGLIGGPFVLAALFDRSGVVQRAVVVRKNETITPVSNGGFVRKFSLDVKYPKSDLSDAFPVRTDQAHYDSVAFGDPVTLRALRSRPSIARLETMDSRDWLATMLPLELFVPVVAIALIVAGIGFAGGKGAAKSFRNPVAMVLVATGLFTCYRDNRPYRGPPPPAEPTVATQARVRAIHLVDELWATSRRHGVDLSQPYLLLELEFTPAGRRAPVVAVDAVDKGSIPYLAKDQSLAVKYEAADPRSVRLDAGTRRFSGQNPLSPGEQLVLLVVLVIAFFAVLALARRAGGRLFGKGRR